MRPPAWPATWPDPSPGDGTLRLLLQRLLPAALCGCPAPSTPPATGTLSPLSLSFPLSLLLALSLPLAGWLVSGSDTPSPASSLCLLVCDPPPVCPGPSGPWGSPGPAPHWLPPGCPSAPLSLPLRPRGLWVSRPLSRSRTPSSCFPLVPPSPLPRPPRSSPPPPPPPSETSKNVREKTLAAQQPGGLAGPQRPVMGRRQPPSLLLSCLPPPLPWPPWRPLPALQAPPSCIPSPSLTGAWSPTSATPSLPASPLAQPWPSCPLALSTALPSPARGPCSFLRCPPASLVPHSAPLSFLFPLVSLCLYLCLPPSLPLPSSPLPSSSPSSPSLLSPPSRSPFSLCFFPALCSCYHLTGEAGAPQESCLLPSGEAAALPRPLPDGTGRSEQRHPTRQRPTQPLPSGWESHAPQKWPVARGRCGGLASGPPCPRALAKAPGGAAQPTVSPVGLSRRDSLEHTRGEWPDQGGTRLGLARWDSPGLAGTRRGPAPGRAISHPGAHQARQRPRPP